MEYITLKNSDLLVSRLCIGGCPMGGYGWGEVLEQELIEAVHTALEHGVTFFDTADTYGLGQSEITLGKALGKHRAEVVIADKFGVKVGPNGTTYDNSPEYLQQALDASLKRLGTDYIDLYQVHYRDGVTPLEIVADTMEGLRKAGKIRYFGLSNLHSQDFAELGALKGEFVSVQDEYSLACRKNEDDLNILRDDFDLTPLTWGSLGQGILTGKYNNSTTFAANDRRSRDIYVNFHGEKMQKNLEIVEAMKPIAAAHGKPLSAVAIRFILDHLKDSVVLVGAKRPAQVLGNIEGCDWQLSPEEQTRLDQVSA
ncbi:MAG: aldo/keto reductase [Victivallales bacterium]|nr:aldo/keto reductase [Victivallales bacterium]